MAVGRPLDVPTELIEAFVHSGRVSEYLVHVLPDRIWRLDPPSGRGRTVAAIVAHMQGVRRTFARMGGVRTPGPALDRRRVTRAQAERALRASTDGLARAFTTALADGRARVKGQPRRAIDMLTYLIQHDAHHRGQISVLARDLGHEFAGEDVTRIWGWKKLPEGVGSRHAGSKHAGSKHGGSKHAGSAQ
jgi:uncharacterized damage-inducible protein DinB